MAVTPGTNSWVTIAESDAYLVQKIGAGAWAGLADADKEPYLVTAFRALYYNKNYTIPITSTADAVKAAQIETAWFYYLYYTAVDKRAMLYSSGVREFQISKFMEKLEQGTYIPWITEGMLKDYVSWAAMATFERELD